MKERPILFSAPMVRALLTGTKTQTRRIVKHPGLVNLSRIIDIGDGWWGDEEGDFQALCPYGQPGDRLWVRETWDFFPDGTGDEPNAAVIRYWAGGEWERRLVPDGFNPLLYGHERRRPSIHMPRWASRITLEITSIRVERLRDISEKDAIAEGIERQHDGIGWKRGPISGDIPNTATRTAFPRLAFQSLWESINGAGSWDANPWVWVVEFKRVDL